MGGFSLSWVQNKILHSAGFLNYSQSLIGAHVLSNRFYNFFFGKWKCELSWQDHHLDEIEAFWLGAVAGRSFYK